MCGEGVETIRHIHSQCRPKGFNLYTERHDRALLVVYYDLCKHYGFEVTSRSGSLKLCRSIKTNTRGPSSRRLSAGQEDQVTGSHWDGSCLVLSPGREKSWEALQVWGTLCQPERTVPWLPFGHCASVYWGPGYGHSPSGGRLRPPPYCGEDCVTGHRNAALCAVFRGTNPEKSLVSARAGSLNTCGICCRSSTCKDHFPPSLCDEG